MIEQRALDAPELRRLVDAVGYRPGWRVELVDDLDRGQGSVGTTLCIHTSFRGTLNPER